MRRVIGDLIRSHDASNHPVMIGWRFSDLLAGETVLFQPEVDTEPLKHALPKRFRGQEVDIQEISDCAVGQTPYLSGHLKLKPLKPMQKAGLITSSNQKREGQFPAGTRISFPS